MLSRAPPLLLSTHAGLSPLCYSCYTPSLSAAAALPLRQTRCYAQHAHPAASNPHGHAADLSWPDPVAPHTTPSPYQILACQRGEAYSKQRFYALVKLYHPDRFYPSSPVAHVPHPVRLERYRLLVAAHAILADDSKRRAYDLWGMGWAGHQPSQSSQSAQYGPERKPWPPGHDPMMNATWEDWEGWYRREYGGEQNGDSRTPAMHMSNVAFVSIVFALVTLGGIMQGTRANMFSTSVMEQRDRIHREASIELARSKRATISGDRNERIRTFLEHREATMAGEDAYQRVLPHPETCAPDTVRKQ